MDSFLNVALTVFPMSEIYYPGWIFKPTTKEFRNLPREMEGLKLVDEDTVAVVTYTPDSEPYDGLDDPVEAGTDTFKGCLDNLSFDLSLENAKAIVIKNGEEHPEPARQLGFEQLPSGLWYLKPSITINVSPAEYMPARSGAKLWMYKLSVSFSPDWNSERSEELKQYVDVSSVGRAYSFFLEAMRERGISDEAEIAGIRYSLTIDHKLCNFLTEYSAERAKEFFGGIVEGIEKDGRVAGVYVEVRPGYSTDHWGYFSAETVHSLGFETIEPSGTLWFKKLDQYAASAG